MHRRTWESRKGARSGRQGLRGDGSACLPRLTIGQRAPFSEISIAKTVKTFDNSYLQHYQEKLETLPKYFMKCRPRYLGILSFERTHTQAQVYILIYVSL
jgi:hypothetical protein